jgi:Phasin protein
MKTFITNEKLNCWRNIMGAQDPSGKSPVTSSFRGFGQDQMAAGMALQKELLESYQKAASAWLARVQAETEMWSELTEQLSGARSMPEVLETYTKCISHQLQMAADDGKRLFNDCQQITQKITKAISNGYPTSGR